MFGTAGHLALPNRNRELIERLYNYREKPDMRREL